LEEAEAEKKLEMKKEAELLRNQNKKTQSM